MRTNIDPAAGPVPSNDLVIRRPRHEAELLALLETETEEAARCEICTTEFVNGEPVCHCELEHDDLLEENGQCAVCGVPAVCGVRMCNCAASVDDV